MKSLDNVGRENGRKSREVMVVYREERIAVTGLQGRERRTLPACEP